MSEKTGYRTRRDIEAFLEELGERSVRLALESGMRFPMPFGEYHAAMWLARRDRERRDRQRQYEAIRLNRTLDDASASIQLERGARFATGAGLVALIALALGGFRG
jgi:hypothetical protein